MTWKVAARAALSTLPPLIALMAEWLLAPLIQNHHWFLFYPAVFVSSWIGGSIGGMWATALSTATVWWFFVPPAHAVVKDDLRALFPAAILVGTGVAFSFFHDRLRKLHARVVGALDSARDANDDLVRAQSVARIGSWRIDARRGSLQWSQETYRIFAIPPATPMTYDTFLAAVHPDDREQVDRSWKAAVSGQPYDIEHRIVAGGEVRWVREQAELAFDMGGALIGGIGTVQDVTERKQAEAAIARAAGTEKRLRAELEEVARAASAISESVAELARYDLDTVLHTVALQAQSLTGADFVGLGLGIDPAKPFEHWVVAGTDREVEAAVAHRPRPVGTLGKVAREGESIRVLDVREHSDFAGFPSHHPEIGPFLGVPIRYRGAARGNLYLARKPGSAAFSERDERLLQMLAARAGVAIETATLYAGEALQRAWLQTIIDELPEAVVFVDEQRKVALQNAAARALALPDAEDRPFPWDVRYADGAKVPVERLPLQGAVARGESVLGAEFALADAQGQLVPVLVSATPVRVGGRISGAVGVFQDIRALKEIERLRAEWASLVAHDLRQPVHSITLALSLLRRLHKGGISDDEQKALERIKDSSARLEPDDRRPARRLAAGGAPPLGRAAAGRSVEAGGGHRPRPRSSAADRRRARADGADRSRPDPAGAREPALQRGQVRRSRRGDPRRAVGPQSVDRGGRDQPRARHPAGRAAEPLQPLRQDARGARRPEAGAGAGALHLAGADRGPRRPDVGREHSRRDHQLPLHGAAGVRRAREGYFATAGCADGVCVVLAGTAFAAAVFFCGGFTLAIPHSDRRASLKIFAIRGEVSGGTSAHGRIASARLNWSVASLSLPVSV